MATYQILRSCGLLV